MLQKGMAIPYLPTPSPGLTQWWPWASLAPHCEPAIHEKANVDALLTVFRATGLSEEDSYAQVAISSHGMDAVEAVEAILVSHPFLAVRRLAWIAQGMDEGQIKALRAWLKGHAIHPACLAIGLLPPSAEPMPRAWPPWTILQTHSAYWKGYASGSLDLLAKLTGSRTGRLPSFSLRDRCLVINEADPLRLPEDLRIIPGSLSLANCWELRSLPPKLAVEGHLDLRNCVALARLPFGLVVAGEGVASDQPTIDMTGCHGWDGRWPDRARIRGRILCATSLLPSEGGPPSVLSA
jgi:hypothetical protein